MKRIKKRVLFFVILIKHRIAWLITKLKIHCSGQIKLIIGAGRTKYNGWIATEKYILDICNPESWKKLIGRKTVYNILAEHVFEHLTYEQINTALLQMNKYLHIGGIIRVAVPDAYHPSQYVKDLVKPGGLEPGADDHKIFLNITEFEQIALHAGFKVMKLEYFDHLGFFHAVPFSYVNGYIKRCANNYKGRFTDNLFEYNKLLETTPEHLRAQFKEKKISYTSLLVDLVKI